MAVVGAGGNGSIFITHLCRIHQAWTKLGGEPFEITIIDDDVVSEANLARQVFCEADIGIPKAMVLAQRMRAFFGIPVKFEVAKFSRANQRQPSDVIAGCVDNIAARKQMQKVPSSYWLDLGNAADAGQVVLGGHGLPDLFQVFPFLATMKDPKDLPSCSMAESLAKQDLFINSTIATLAAQLLWQVMRHGGLNHHGFVVNLKTGRTMPIEIK